MVRRKKIRTWLYILGIVVMAAIVFIIYFNIVVRIPAPTETDPRAFVCETTIAENGWTFCNESWFNINDHQLGELYIKGNPLELGIMHGVLLQEYVQMQEEAFVKQIRVMIPSESYLKFLKYFIAWFNKDLDDYIKPEYLLEIYGVSAYASDNYGFVGPKYNRILNYHAAHDIGHALQNMSLVECTAFGVWDEKSADSSLLIGRNFDFYVGDDFARNKFIAFVDPESGYQFAHISWAGMIGVTSGMNEKGLTVTLNSAKSEIPYGARTPVSIIAREILQYASNIEEAMAIASERKSFVSESFLIGSAHDHKVVVLEKSTDTTVLYDPGTNHIILTNHFQSEHFMNDALNIENIENETSVYRHERVQELLSAKENIDYLEAASILRDRRGKNWKNIGNGNEKAINQLIAHHSIIFKPEEKRLWISTGRYQLGSYLCYDLDSIFALDLNTKDNVGISITELEIPPDTNFGPEKLIQHDVYKGLIKSFQQAIDAGDTIHDEQVVIRELINYNPEFYHTYFILGQYYQQRGNIERAIENYNVALTKEVSSANEREKIIQKLEECNDK